MSRPPTPPHIYLSPNAVASQIVADIKQFSKAQVFPSLIMAAGAFIYAWATGQVTSPGYAALFILYSLVAGLLLYLLIAIIRAPIIVIGWHLRQLSGLSLKLRDLDTALTSQSPTNSFSDFRVLAESRSYLSFEVWYLCEERLGIDVVEIEAWASENGKLINQIYNREDVNILPLRAYLELNLKFIPREQKNPEESYEESVESTGIMLAMRHKEKDTIFHRQEVKYKKVWQGEILS
ncbi:MAG: hypothetical protein AABM67_11415 [Acidobacteriota bacterium]